jgi:hypothetical protein
MPNHFLLRVGDGAHFTSSSKFNIWGINSKTPDGSYFIKNVKENDILWFVKGKSRGQLIAMATFTSLKERVVGPLIALTPTNEELGWTKITGEWDKEVHFKNLFNLSDCELYSEIKSPLVIRLYSEKCKVNLPQEYINICRYSKIKKTM